MKKIIYSLVIMIAAGSLFTSCVTNTEPQGIKDIREAKANYLDALANLRAADAEKVKAEATLVQAQAATEQARAAWVQAKAKAEEINNQFVSDTNAIYLAKAKAEAEVALKEAEADLVKQEEALAWAEESLRKALVAIALEANKLTWAEQTAISDYTRAYNKVLAKQAEVKRAEADLYDATYNKYGENSVEAQKAIYENEKANAETRKAFWEETLALHEEMAEEEITNYEEWVKKYDALQAEIAGFAYDKAEIERDSALNDYENKEALDSFYTAIAAKKSAIAKATKGFSMDLSGKKVLELPDLKISEGTNFVDRFVEGVNKLTVPAGQWIKADSQKDTLGAYFIEPDVAEGVVDTLNIIIDALQREKVIVDQLVKDTAGIAAFADSLKHEYDSIKTDLVAGVDAYKPIADSVAATKKAKETFDAAKSKFVADTAALIKSVKDFVEVWNNVASKRTVKRADSTEVFEAFINVMKAREAAVETAEKNLRYHFYGYSFSPSTGVVKAVPDSAKFSDLNVKGIWNDNDELNYAGDKALDGSYVAGTNRFQKVLSAAFGCTYFDGKEFESGDEIKFDEIVTATGYLKTALFKEYWVNYYTKNADWGKVITVNPGTVYESTVVKEAKTAWDKAKNGEKIARENYYEKVYSKFWGINPAIKESPTDSLKIVYTEKTYTDPTVLVTFSGETNFFKAATKDSPLADIDWDKVNYNDSSLALKVIKTELGQNNISINEDGKYTLYAQYLAAKQFASDAKNYKENSAALAELVKVVAAVETAYNDAVAATKSGSAAKDSLMIALTGKKDGTILDKTNKPITYKFGESGAFIKADGSFNLAGEQKVLAEKYLADYAKKFVELEKQKADIAATIVDNKDLSDIYAEYVKDLAVLDGNYSLGDDTDDIYEYILGKWNDAIEKMQGKIEKWEKKIKLAEGKIAKLEAGYDSKQIDIEGAQKALDEAKKALEQAEVELAAAEAAYKQVLANHGITE